MHIATIPVTNKLDPFEVQLWFDVHPEVVVVNISNADGVFYIVYE